MTVGEVEKYIQRLLLDLADETGERIDFVEVDCRNYSNYAVTIMMAQKLKTDREKL